MKPEGDCGQQKCTAGPPAMQLHLADYNFTDRTYKRPTLLARTICPPAYRTSSQEARMKFPINIDARTIIARFVLSPVRIPAKRSKVLLRSFLRNEGSLK